MKRFAGKNTLDEKMPVRSAAAVLLSSIAVALFPLGGADVTKLLEQIDGTLIARAPRPP